MLHCMDSPFEPWIRVRGARTHNLQNIDVDVPRDRFTVFTGPSGSGRAEIWYYAGTPDAPGGKEQGGCGGCRCGRLGQAGGAKAGQRRQVGYR